MAGLLRPEALPESILTFDRGLEFDLAAQRAFEDLLLAAHNDLYHERTAPAEEQYDPGLSALWGWCLSSRMPRIGVAVSR